MAFLAQIAARKPKAPVAPVVDDKKLDDKQQKLKDELASLTPTDIEKLKEAFALFDKDNSGSIDEDELLEILVSLDPRITRDEFKLLVKEYDTDGDGQFSFDEFCVLMKPAILGDNAGDDVKISDQDIKAAFDIADADGSGFIDKEELGILLKSLGTDLDDDDLTALMNEMDEDGSGGIDFEEFKQLMQVLNDQDSDDDDDDDDESTSWEYKDASQSSYTWITDSDADSSYEYVTDTDNQ